MFIGQEKVWFAKEDCEAIKCYPLCLITKENEILGIHVSFFISPKLSLYLIEIFSMIFLAPSLEFININNVSCLGDSGT